MAVSKKNDDDSDDSDVSDTIPSSPKKTSEELFQLAANATLPARRRIQPNMYGSTPSPSPPPLPKPTSSKKKPTTSKKNAPLVNSGRTNQSNSKTKKKRGRQATKKKTPSAPITTSAPTNVLPGNPSLTLNGTFLGSLSLCLFYVCVEHTDHSF